MAMSADYEAEAKKLKARYYELQTLLDTYSKQTDDIRRFAKLVEAYTDMLT